MKINLYDFDNTIYKGDSSVDFYFYNLVRTPAMFLHIFVMIYAGLLYILKIINKTRMKEYIFSYLKFINVDKRLDSFWRTHTKNIKKFYLDKKHDQDIIISASPEFLLRPMEKYLGVKMLLASRVDKSTGKFDGLNCHGEEKVRRLNEVITGYEVMESYSDSTSDDPILKLAKKAYYVKGDKLIEAIFKEN